VKKSASFNVLADGELTDAVAFYELEAEGLGAALLDIVEDAVADLRKFPESGEVLKGSYRRKVLRRFPFSLIYRINDREVRILAVMHHKRRPFYWQGRR
jgi:toxin ParE1/3/4